MMNGNHINTKDQSKNTMSKKYWNKNISAMEGYTYGIQPDITPETIKLNTNESPYPPSPIAIDAICKIAGSELRLYPKAQWDDLRKALADEYNVSTKNIFCSNGSDEFLSLLFRTFVNPGETVCLTDPTYSLYSVLACSQGINVTSVECTPDFRIDFEILQSTPAEITIITNPNAPTGLKEPLEKIENFIKHRKGLVVIDEAYFDFSKDPEKTSAINLINTYDNVLVARTFSKSFSLCGIRAGYAFGNQDLIMALMTAKDSYNLDAIAQAAAEAAIRDISWMKKNAAKVIATRDNSAQKFQQLGFTVLPSEANFLMISHPKLNAKNIYKQLLDKDIYIRYFPTPRLEKYLRVSIGSDNEMERFFTKLEEIIHSELVHS